MNVDLYGAIREKELEILKISLLVIGATFKHYKPVSSVIVVISFIIVQSS